MVAAAAAEEATAEGSARYMTGGGKIGAANARLPWDKGRASVWATKMRRRRPAMAQNALRPCMMWNREYNSQPANAVPVLRMLCEYLVMQEALDS